MVFPGVRAMRTASALNSAVNTRRFRAGLDNFFMNTSSMTGERWEVSTKSGRVQCRSDCSEVVANEEDAEDSLYRE